MSAAPRTHVQLEPSWDSLKPRSPRWTRYPQYRIGTVFRICSSVSCSLPALLTGFGMQPPRRDALLLTNHEQGDATLLNVVLSHDRAHTRSHVTAVSSKQVATNQIGVFVLRRQSRGIATLYHPLLVHRGALLPAFINLRPILLLYDIVFPDGALRDRSLLARWSSSRALCYHPAAVTDIKIEHGGRDLTMHRCSSAGI